MLLHRIIRAILSTPPAPKRSKRRPTPKRSRPGGGRARRQDWRVPNGRAGPAPAGRTVIAYHGTPTIENAKSILRHGWVTGAGNAAGDGKYFALDMATAKSYAGSQGVYLKCRIRLGKCCAQWTHALQRQFQGWCQARGITQDNSARTAFLLNQRYDTLMNGNVVVVLSPQMPAAYKTKDHRIRVVSIHRASDGCSVRV
jgi:hypothetical protein